MRRKFCVAKPGSFLVVMRNGSENGRHRFLMIGIDAMSLPFVVANRDRLPVFSGLLQEGTLRALSTPANMQAPAFGRPLRPALTPAFTDSIIRCNGTRAG